MIRNRFAAIAAFLFVLGVPAFAQHQVTLICTWSVGSGGPATQINFKRGTSNGGPYTSVGNVPVPLTSPPTTYTFVDLASSTNVLAEGQTYFYICTAANPTNGTESIAGPQASALIPFTPPSMPTGLSASPK